MASVVVAKDPKQTAKATAPSLSNNGKQLSNSQAGNEPRKILQSKKEGKGANEGKTYSPKTENVWNTRAAQNTRQGTRLESQGSTDELSQKFGVELHLNERGGGGGEQHSFQEEQRWQRRGSNRSSGGYRSSPSQRTFKRGNPAHDSHSERTSAAYPKREYAPRDTSSHNYSYDQHSQYQQQGEEGGERTGSPNNPSSAKSSKSKVKLSLAEFISKVGGGENGEDEVPSRVLWVGNIGPEVSEEELTQEFLAYGKLESLRILHDRFCAFVNFEDQECAKKAKAGLNGTIVGSQYIVINYRKADSKPAPSNANWPPVNSENNFILNTPSRALWIGNISDEVTEEDLFREFSQFGEIESVRLLTHKTCAFVNFMTVEDATNALQMLQGKELGNMPIKINFGKPPKRPHDIYNQYLPNAFIPQPFFPAGLQYGFPPSPYLPPMAPYMSMGSIEPQYPMFVQPPSVCELCGLNPREMTASPCGHSYSCNDCLMKLRLTSPEEVSKCLYCMAAVEKYLPFPYGPFGGYNSPNVAPNNHLTASQSMAPYGPTPTTVNAVNIAGPAMPTLEY